MSRQGLWREARRAVVLGLGTAALALLPTAAPAVGATEPPSPDRYLQIDWVVGSKPHWIAKKGSTWEVIGRHGKLEIDFNRERMREEWEFDTPALLSLRGFVDSPESGRRNIEIPGYSTVKDGLKVVELDLGAASAVVQQMFQGARFAHRIAYFEDWAKIEGLRAEMEAIQKRVALQDQLIADVERTVGVLYNEAFAFLLDERDVVEAAETIAAARARLAGLVDTDKVGKQREVEAYWSAIDVQGPGIEAWLGGVLAPENRPYLSIVAPIVGREEHVILAVGEGIRELLKERAEGGLTPDAEAEAKEKLTTVAKLLLKLESDLQQRYSDLVDANAPRLTALTGASQYKERAGDGLSLKELFSEVKCVKATIRTRAADELKTEEAEDTEVECSETPRAAAAGRSCECQERVKRRGAECWMQPAPKPDHRLRNPRETEVERAESRFEVIEARLRELVGSDMFSAAKEKALARFKAEAKAAFNERNTAKRLLREKADQIHTKQVELVVEHRWREGCPPLTRLGDRLEAVLVIEVIHALIDRIPRVTLSLDALDLEPGDTLGIVASFLPPRSPGAEPPAQQTCTFEVVPWGWDSPVPDGKEMLSFVEGEDQDGFAPAFGTAALWHWYGRSQRRPSAKRTFAPGFGIAAHFLDFDGDESTIEIGLGPVVSFFDDILHVGYGWNLQAKGTPSYLAVGVSFTSVVDKFKKKD